MFVLDTNVVSELRKASAGKAETNVITWAASVATDTLFLSVVTIFELELGVLQLERRDPAQGALLRTWLDGHVIRAFEGRILPIDSTVARRSARLHVPDRCSDRDAMIAATALAQGMAVVTRNTHDFERTGVQTINPWNHTGK